MTPAMHAILVVAELQRAALNPEALRVVQPAKLGQLLGRERMFFNVEVALERYEQLSASNRLDEPKPLAGGSPGVGGAV